VGLFRPALFKGLRKDTDSVVVSTVFVAMGRLAVSVILVKTVLVLILVIEGTPKYVEQKSFALGV